MTNGPLSVPIPSPSIPFHLCGKRGETRERTQMDPKRINSVDQPLVNIMGAEIFEVLEYFC